MERNSKLEIDAAELKRQQQRVEEAKKPELDDPDLIAADDSGASAMAQKLADKSDQER